MDQAKDSKTLENHYKIHPTIQVQSKQYSTGLVAWQVQGTRVEQEWRKNHDLAAFQLVSLFFAIVATSFVSANALLKTAESAQKSDAFISQQRSFGPQLLGGLRFHQLLRTQIFSA